MKNITDTLLRYAQSNGIDHITVWNDFLQFCVDMLSFTDDEIRGFRMGERLAEYSQKNKTFFEVLLMMAEDASVNAYKDHFGAIYEEFFKSRMKASTTGQFFTHIHICQLMAHVSGVNETTGGTVSDCACGSGRTLIAHAKVAYENEQSRYNSYVYHGGDIDSTSVAMCALNLAINGMVGGVENCNALTQEWRYGYIVNDIKVPYYNDMLRIKKYTDRDAFMERFNWLQGRKDERERFLRDAFSGEPKRMIEDKEKKEVKIEKQPKPVERKKYEQLTLF